GEWAARDASSNISPGSRLAGFYTANTSTTLAGNADMSGGVDTTLASSPTLTSLRFNDNAARTITATGQTLTTGGILVSPAVGNNPSVITGGTLRGAAGSANQDLIISQNNTAAALTINSAIVDNTSATALTKSGKGTLMLSQPNTYTGTTTVNEGILKLSNATALPGAVDSTVGAGESALTLNGGVIG